MINHADHDHPATSAARSACRKAATNAATQEAADIARFISIMGDWTFYAASRFAKCQTKDINEAAKAAIAHFAPSGDEATDRRRIADGWTITTNFNQIRSITLQAAS